MSATAVGDGGKSLQDPSWIVWLPIIAGLLILYWPGFSILAHTLWASEAQAHGPIVLAVSLWLLWRKWPLMWARSRECSPAVWGWPVFVIGLLLYVIGRSQDILIFEIGSLIWVLAALLLLMRGRQALQTQWFALFFMIFMIPLPGTVVDAATMPMKMAVSYVAEHILYAAGYPIARSGVILQIAQYKLLVADACAGLHTLFTLEAMGLLYLNVVQRDSLFRNLGLALLIVPISFSANVVRVMVLTLITYHFGDAAGQGFLHGFAGMLLFMTALLLIMGVDAVMHWLEQRYRSARLTRSAAEGGIQP